MPLAGQADPLGVVDPRRDLDFERPLLRHAAGALAVGARLADDLAGPAAVRACLAPDELAEDGRRHGLEPPRSAAPGAVLGGRARGGATAVAGRAGDGDRERHALRDAARSLGQLDLDLGEEVGAAASAAARRGSEQVLAEEDREDVGEAAEVEVGRTEPAGLEPFVAEAVVELTGLGLREHLVGLGSLAEALLGVGVIRDVGMQLAREAAKRLLDLTLVRRA